MKKALSILLLTFPFFSYPQVIPANRIVSWNYAGLSTPSASYSNVIDITALGGNGNGTTLNDVAFANSVATLNGMPGVIFFPAGIYLFHSPINVPDSTILRGESSTLSMLKFDFNGGAADCIGFTGTVQTVRYNFASDGIAGSKQLQLVNTAGLQVGSFVKILQNDSALVFSSWALGTVGQIAKIKTVNGNNIELEHELRKNYTVSDSSYLRVMAPMTGSGMECLYLERLDSTTTQTSNIIFFNAVDCWISGVESNMTNFAHVTLRSSSNIYIHESYFHHAFAYGGNGQGYGINCETSSGECLVENNIFNNLRHSMLCQAGVNGNVFAYNYSVNPFWSQSPFPSNAAGDIVLHGNYAFANLFEGNIVQNIIIDNSHDINGPYNTIFRNRAELYGIVMNSNPATNNQNFVGNEIPNTGIFLGNYSLAGSGHFEHGNNVKGAIMPAGTTSLSDSSYYLTQKPSFFGNNTWPCIGMPAPFNQLPIPAKLRFNIQNTLCSINTTVNEVPKQEGGFKILMRDNGNVLEVINTDRKRIMFSISDIEGRLLLKTKITEQKQLNLTQLPNGMYVISNERSALKFIKNSY